jgi:cytochrome bd-type quinol oxidase subunit 1
MNYPPWDMPGIGGAALIAVIAILHVFISHFAVGASLFNVLTERRARRLNDAALLAFVRTHSFVLLLLSMVLGALTGVGIWFVIGLVQPTGTSTLIRIFLWAWACEWVVFVVEVSAGYAYYYTWDRVAPQIHLRLGWIYAGAAWMSLVLINGILTFMLTPGDWFVTGRVADAFFNPSYWPSLALRAMVALALAGLYALLMATLHPRETERPALVRYTAKWVAYPLLAMAPAAVWYIEALPRVVTRWFLGTSAPLTMFFLLSALFTALILGLVLLIAIRQPRNFTWPTAVLVMFFGLLSTASTEMVREAIRRPFIIYGYLYSNAIRLTEVEQIQARGILALAKWAPVRTVTAANRMEAGRTVFELQCQICHTLAGFNGILPLTDGWREQTLDSFIDRMHETNHYMPPFLGTPAERQALSAWLAGLHVEMRGGSPEPSP